MSHGSVNMNKLIVIEKEEAQDENSSLLVMQVDMIKDAAHVILSISHFGILGFISMKFIH